MAKRTQLPRMLSVGEITDHLGVGNDTVLGWIQSGELIATNVGRGKRLPRWRIKPSDLDAFLESRRAVREAPQAVACVRRRPPGVGDYV